MTDCGKISRIVNLYEKSHICKHFVQSLAGIGSVMECRNIEHLESEVISHNQSCQFPDIVNCDDAIILRVAYVCTVCQSLWHVRLANVKKYGPVEYVISSERRAALGTVLTRAT